MFPLSTYLGHNSLITKLRDPYEKKKKLSNVDIGLLKKVQHQSGSTCEDAAQI